MSNVGVTRKRAFTRNPSGGVAVPVARGTSNPGFEMVQTAPSELSAISSPTESGSRTIASCQYRSEVTRTTAFPCDDAATAGALGAILPRSIIDVRSVTVGEADRCAKTGDDTRARPTNKAPRCPLLLAAHLSILLILE